MSLVKSLEVRKRQEDKEKRRLEVRAEKIASREKRIEQKKLEMDLFAELSKPVEDMELSGKQTWLLIHTFYSLGITIKKYSHNSLSQLWE